MDYRIEIEREYSWKLSHGTRLWKADALGISAG